MNFDMIDWALVVAGVALLAAGLWYKPTRLAMAVLGLLAAVALSSTLYLGFIGIPLMLVCGAILYAEFAHRTIPAPAGALTAPASEAPVTPHRADPPRSPRDEDMGPGDDA